MYWLAECVDQFAQHRRGVADQRHLGLVLTPRFVGVGVDAHDLQVFVDAPMRHRIQHLGADAEHRVGFAPQLPAKRQSDAERIAVVQHSAPAPVRHHRRLQHARQEADFERCLLRASADADENVFGFAEQLGRGAHGVVVDLGCSRRNGRSDSGNFAAFAPVINGAFERGRTGPAADHRTHCLGGGVRRVAGAGDERGVIDQPRDNAGLVAISWQIVGA